MKNRLVHYKFSLCAVVICGLLASPLFDITHAQTTRQVSPGEARVVAQEDGERLAIKCPHAPVVMMAGKADGFAGGVEPATLSPALNAFYVANHTIRREFDEGKPDKAFGQSFTLNPCKICDASLELNIKNEQPGGLSNNDSLTVGVAPFTPALKFATIYPLWSNSLTPLTKIVTVHIPAAALNGYIMSNANGPWQLDLHIQDDTAVDYAKLTVWYY